MSKLRNDEQAAVVDLYIEMNPLRATGVLSTGFGKSKVALDILERKNPKKIVILVNSTILRDDSWKAEFIKFGHEKMYNERVEMVTYQLAYKWRPETKDLEDVFVICDEIDFAADTDELSKFFYAYPKVQMLGLTGFITDGKKEWFELNMPVITTLTADTAQEKGILNNIHIVFVKYDLSDAKTVSVAYKQHGVDKFFKQSENASYDYANKQCHIKQGELSQLEVAFMAGEVDRTEYMKKQRNLEYLLNMMNKKRSDILLESVASATVAKKLIAYTHAQNPESKVIVFSKRTSQSLEICGEDQVYNGTIDKKTADANFKKFQTGYIKTLGVCEKVNRGANIPGLDIGICETFYGSDTHFTQRLGRLMRLNPEDTATMYVQLPYYMRKEKNKRYTVQETQQVKWALSMLRSTVIKSHEVWDYRTVKTNDKNE